jgi:hypothetical protein
MRQSSCPGLDRTDHRTRDCGRSRSVWRAEFLRQHLAGSFPRVGFGQTLAGDSVAGAAQLLCQVAATPGVRSTGIGTAVARLLSPDQTGSPGDYRGRDRRRHVNAASPEDGGTTSTGTREALVLILRSPRAFRSTSSIAPVQPHPSVITSARVAASFLPMPPDNNSASSPPNTAVSEPTSRDRQTARSLHARPDPTTHAGCAYPTKCPTRPVGPTADRSDPPLSASEREPHHHPGPCRVRCWRIDATPARPSASVKGGSAGRRS